MAASTQQVGRAVIITGASSGCGRVIATQLAEVGFDLFLVGRSLEGLKVTADAAARLGHETTVKSKSLDVARPGALSAYVEEVAGSHGYLFALINNAGVMHPEPILGGGRMDRWRAMMDINYFAPLEGCVAAVAAMRAHGRAAHLINISSIAAGIESMGPYSASKKALEIMSETLRTELQGDRIRVTILVPGVFATNLGRDISPEMGARLIEGARSKGFDLTAGINEQVMGDPQHIARAVRYILEQPASINIERMVVRPPADLSF